MAGSVAGLFASFTRFSDLASGLVVAVSMHFSSACVRLARWHVPEFPSGLSLSPRFFFRSQAEAFSVKPPQSEPCGPARGPQFSPFGGTVSNNVFLKRLNLSSRVHVTLSLWDSLYRRISGHPRTDQ